MTQTTAFLLLVVTLSQVSTAPQFITFDDGKLGVNFGGYHAGVGLGGILGSGAGGGLFAEAGTPHGQAARAGLGGAVDSNGGAAGGLYAGATAGGNVKASAGLAGGATAEKTGGVGYAAAQAGNNHQASAGLGGATSLEGSTGFSFAGSKSFGISNGVVKDFEIVDQPVETTRVKSVEKKVHKEYNTETSNELNAVPLTSVSKIDVEAKSGLQANVNVPTQSQPSVLVKEVVYQPPPIIKKRIIHPPPVVEKHVYVEQPQIVEKTVVRTHYKPRRQHFRKTAYIGGYIGDISSPSAPVVFKTVQPIIEKRIDIGSENTAVAGIGANVGAAAEANFNGGGAGGVAYTKQVTFQRNPSFFADIFNIPISTLKAVGNFLGNTAENTKVSVQKTATLHAGTGAGADSVSISPKHVSSSSASSSDTQISLQTPTASKIINDILAIPINTLGAVNKFLENNVSARKNVQISQVGTGEPTKIRLGPHARRRANKHVVVVEENVQKSSPESPDNVDSK